MANAFDGVEVFSATQAADRDQLGESVTAWLAAHPEIEMVDLVIQQSSDDRFHCITITVFFKGVLKYPHGSRKGIRRATTKGDRDR